MVACPVNMAWPRMKSALATDASPATAASEPEMRRAPSMLEVVCLMERTMARGKPGDRNLAIYCRPWDLFKDKENMKRTSLRSAPVPHHTLTPSELLPRATVPRLDADILADSPLASSQLSQQRAGKVDGRPDQ